MAGAGFRDVALEPIDEPIELGLDADDAFSFVSRVGFVKGLTEDRDEATRSRAMARLHDMLAARATPDGVLLGRRPGSSPPAGPSAG